MKNGLKNASTNINSVFNVIVPFFAKSVIGNKFYSAP